MTFYNLFTHLNTMNNFNLGLNFLSNQETTFTQFNVFNQPFSNFCSFPTFDWNTNFFNTPSFFNFSNFNTPFFSNFNTLYTSKLPEQFTNSWSTTTNNYAISDSYNFRLDNSKQKTNKKQNNSSKNSYSYRENVQGSINNSYANLSKSAAYQKALRDSSLENLSNGGRRWQISSASFRTDIPFAKKGTGKILDNVAQLIGVDLVVTSALGTGQGGNPHARGGYASHHNAENPKLDLKIPSGMSATTFAQKLRNTGYFSHILNEGDHIDVQINPEKYRSLEVVA